MHLQRQFTTFVADLAGFVNHYRAVHHATWAGVAKDCGCCTSTIHKLASGKTQNPTLYTCWKVLRALDNRQIIRHSMLEGYRKYSRATVKVIERHAA